MDRHIPLPRFRLDTEENNPSIPTTSASSHILQLHQNQRSQIRTRQSPCSDLQSTTIPEEHIYNGDHRRSSLFTDRPSQTINDVLKMSSDNQRSSKDDNIKSCQQSCQSLYKSLDNKTSSSVSSTKESLKLSDNDNNNNDEEEEEDEDEINFQLPPRCNYRYSLPDASAAGLALRNILKRNKTPKHSRFHIGLPSHLSHSVSTSLSINSSSPLSTFRHFLSLVKLSSTKPINSATAHHSSLTTLTNATGGSSTALDQTTSFISPTMQWHFEVSTYKKKNTRLLITETTVTSQMPYLFDMHQHKLKRDIADKMMIMSPTGL